MSRGHYKSSYSLRVRVRVKINGMNTRRDFELSVTDEKQES